MRLRELLASNADLARKVEAREKKYEGPFQVVFDALRQRMAPPPERRSLSEFAVA